MTTKGLKATHEVKREFKSSGCVCNKLTIRPRSWDNGIAPRYEIVFEFEHLKDEQPRSNYRPRDTSPKEAYFEASFSNRGIDS